VRRIAFNSAVAVLAFAAGSLAAGVGSPVSSGTAYALAQQLPLLILQSFVTVVCFAGAADGIRKRTHIAFTLLMVCGGVLFLVFMVGTVVGATLTGVGFD
jgi:hypothetical protein